MPTPDGVFGEGLLGVTAAAIARLAVVELYDDYTTCSTAPTSTPGCSSSPRTATTGSWPARTSTKGCPSPRSGARAGPCSPTASTAIRSTQFHRPRLIRRFVSGLRVVPDEPGVDGIAMRASFLMVESTNDEPTRILLAGEHRDIVVAVDGRLCFARKVCVYDSPLVPTSLIHPV